MVTSGSVTGVVIAAAGAGKDGEQLAHVLAVAGRVDHTCLGRLVAGQQLELAAAVRAVEFIQRHTIPPSHQVQLMRGSMLSIGAIASLADGLAPESACPALDASARMRGMTALMLPSCQVGCPLIPLARRETRAGTPLPP